MRTKNLTSNIYLVFAAFLVISLKMNSQTYYFENQTFCTVVVNLHVQNSGGTCYGMNGLAFGYGTSQIITGGCTGITNIGIQIIDIDGTAPSTGGVVKDFTNSAQETISTPSPCPCPATTFEYNSSTNKFIFK